MASAPGTASGFDPEAHSAENLDVAANIPEGVTTLTEFFVTKNRPELDSPITCWHCYTTGDVTWCVEIDCPFPQPPKTKPE